MRTGERKPLEQALRRLEVEVRLTRETRHQVASDSHVGDELGRGGHERIHVADIVWPTHRLEYPVGPGLRRDVQESADRVVLGHHVDRFHGAAPGLQRTEPDARLANRGQLRNMFVRTTDAGAVMLIVCFGEDFPQRAPLLDAVAAEFPQITSLYYVINDKKNDTIGDQTCILHCGEPAIYEEMEGLRFKIGPKSFYQTNTGQAYKLYSVTREFAGLTGSETVYDLYTGTGTIAQFVAGRARRVIGIEYVPEAIEDAKINAEGNGITNCEFFAGDMKDVLTEDFIAQHGRPDVIIADPPRAGMHPDVVKTILAAAPRRCAFCAGRAFAGLRPSLTRALGRLPPACRDGMPRPALPGARRTEPPRGALPCARCILTP